MSESQPTDHERSPLAEMAQLGLRLAELARAVEAKAASPPGSPAEEVTADASAERSQAEAIPAEPATSSENVPPGSVRRDIPRRADRVASAVGAASADGTRRLARGRTAGRSPRPPAAPSSKPRPTRQRRRARGLVGLVAGVARRLHGSGSPVVVSTLLHLGLLVLLALVLVAREPRRPERLAILAAVTEEEPLDDLAEVAIEPLDEPLEPVDDLAFEPLADVPLPVALPAQEMADPGGGMDLPASAANDVFAAGFSAEALGEVVQAGGGGGGRQAAGAATFFGRREAGRTFVFLCDNSNSYDSGGFETVLAELIRAVGMLDPSQSFHVVFFSDMAYPMFHPEKVDQLVPATPENKQRLMAWLGTVETCTGGAGIRAATDLALRLAPDAVYFLSDGEHGSSAVQRLMSQPFDPTIVHTFGMFPARLAAPQEVAQRQQRIDALQAIASAHGGSFTPVVVSPEAVMQARARPIKKNRSRGPVWGLTLPPAGER